MAEKNGNECRFGYLCLFEGPGCKRETTTSCEQAKEIEKSHERACPAANGVKCDIPKYRALLGSECNCGSPGRCYIREILKGRIPVQDFELSDRVPELYAGKRCAAGELRIILKAGGL